MASLRAGDRADCRLAPFPPRLVGCGCLFAPPSQCWFSVCGHSSPPFGGPWLVRGLASGDQDHTPSTPFLSMPSGGPAVRKVIQRKNDRPPVSERWSRAWCVDTPFLSLHPDSIFMASC